MAISEYDVQHYLKDDSALTKFMDEQRGSELDFIPIFVGTPSDDFIQDIGAPWIRVTSIPGEWLDYADDERVMEYPRYQIDFWIDKTKSQESLIFEQKIYEIMHDHGFERYYKTRNTDPEMSELLMVQGNFEYRGLF